MLRNVRADNCGNYGTTTQSECYFMPTQQRYAVHPFQYPPPYGNIYEDGVADSDCLGDTYGSDNDERVYPPLHSIVRPKYEENAAADCNANVESLPQSHLDATITSVESNAATALTTYPWMKKITSYAEDGKRKRQSYTRKQTLELEKEFCYSQYLTKKRRGELCHLLQLSEKQIKTWFQNRRMKRKKETADTKNDPQSQIVVDNESLMLIDTTKSIRRIDTVSTTIKSANYWRDNAAAAAVQPQSRPTIKQPSQSYQQHHSSNMAQFIENSSQFYFDNRRDMNYS